MDCPRCRESLREHIYASHVRAEECPQCLGVWLDDGELKQIEKAAEHDNVNLQEVIDRAAQRLTSLHCRHQKMGIITYPHHGVIDI